MHPAIRHALRACDVSQAQGHSLPFRLFISPKARAIPPEAPDGARFLELGSPDGIFGREPANLGLSLFPIAPAQTLSWKARREGTIKFFRSREGNRRPNGVHPARDLPISIGLLARSREVITIFSSRFASRGLAKPLLARPPPSNPPPRRLEEVRESIGSGALFPLFDEVDHVRNRGIHRHPKTCLTP